MSLSEYTIGYFHTHWWKNERRPVNETTHHLTHGYFDKFKSGSRLQPIQQGFSYRSDYLLICEMNVSLCLKQKSLMWAEQRQL